MHNGNSLQRAPCDVKCIRPRERRTHTRTVLCVTEMSLWWGHYCNKRTAIHRARALAPELKTHSSLRAATSRRPSCYFTFRLLAPTNAQRLSQHLFVWTASCSHFNDPDLMCPVASRVNGCRCRLTSSRLNLLWALFRLYSKHLPQC